MKYIKSVHRHGSETFLLVVKDKKSLETKNIIKSSTSENGINSIKSEAEGIDWYNILSKNKISYKLERETINYYRININANKDFFNINFNPNYLKVKKYLDLAVIHYIEIWRNYKGQDFAPLHGDMSLIGNVMFNKTDEVLFIDWEHFENNLKVPTGLDIIIFLLENVFHDLNRTKKLSHDVMIMLQILLKF